MEFRLEDFDNQQEPSIDLEGKSVEENSFGEKEKNLENSPDQIPSTMITLSLQKKKKLSDNCGNLIMRCGVLSGEPSCAAQLSIFC